MDIVHNRTSIIQDNNPVNSNCIKVDVDILPQCVFGVLPDESPEKGPKFGLQTFPQVKCTGSLVIVNV